VIVGDTERIELPDVGRHRAGTQRLRGLRLVHTHLRGESLSKDDLTDLSLLSLDAVAAITIDDIGKPDQVYWAHLLPANQDQTLWETLPPVKIHELHVEFDELIRSLESEFSKGARTTKKKSSFHDRAIVVHVDSGKKASKWDLEEILELCHSAEVEVVEVFTQRRRKADPRFAIGRGKLDDLVLHSMQLEVELLIFSSDLTPGQSRGLTDACELKVLDRTQLILDIFAQRAESRDGKLQVELAQLQYMLPRLIQKNTGMSRLTGGIGGRGPGETKLEINRRRAQDRIRWLKKQLSNLSKKRHVQRQRRSRSNIPIVSIVGYTNSGKSTLLNTLTRSNVIAENKLFATLDTSTRRLRFPQEQEVIITDTVGFIRDLPPSLVAAFKATLEELEHADLLLHVADVSNPNIETQIESVDRIIGELGLTEIPSVMVLNKNDLADAEQTQNLCELLNGVSISALNAEATRDLIVRIHEELYRLDLLHRPENVAAFDLPETPEDEATDPETIEVPTNTA
jgi:GTP-binding protein HflX